eukprot:1182274-Prorocentrum_minimum.AAC.4
MAHSVVVTREKLSKHSHEGDCWIAVHGKVYNVTSFLGEHPGGAQLILEHAGKDATEAFASVHSAAFLDMLPAKALVGILEGQPPNKAAESSNKSEPDNGVQVSKVFSPDRPEH